MKKSFVLFACLVSFSCRLLCEETDSWRTYREESLKNLPQILGWCSKDKAERMMDLIVATHASVCVEIGVFGGSSFYPTVAALAYQKQGLAYAIDPWDPVVGRENLTEPKHVKALEACDFRGVMHRCLDVLHNSHLGAYYCIMRMSSAQAVNHFKDESIDIIHIDGNHSEETSLFDVRNWLPKIKKNGYIWFDDANNFDWPDTKKAVEFLYQNCSLDPSSNPKDNYLLFKKSKI